MAKIGFPSATPANKLHKPTYAAILKHFKNKRRAHITAARNGKDRKHEDRMMSAMLASAVNRMLTGRGYVITRQALGQGDGFSEETRGMLSLNINRYIQTEVNRLFFYKSGEPQKTNEIYERRVEGIALLHGMERMQGYNQQYYAEYEMLLQYMFELDFRKMILLLPEQEIANLRARNVSSIEEEVTRELLKLPVTEFETQKLCVFENVHPEFLQNAIQTFTTSPGRMNSGIGGISDPRSLQETFLFNLLGPVCYLYYRVMDKLYMSRDNADGEILNLYLESVQAFPATGGIPPKGWWPVEKLQDAANIQLNKCTMIPLAMSQELFNMLQSSYEISMNNSPENASPDGKEVIEVDQAPAQVPTQAPVQAPTTNPALVLNSATFTSAPDTFSAPISTAAELSSDKHAPAQPARPMSDTGVLNRGPFYLGIDSISLQTISQMVETHEMQQQQQQLAGQQAQNLIGQNNQQMYLQPQQIQQTINGENWQIVGQQGQQTQQSTGQQDQEWMNQAAQNYAEWEMWNDVYNHSSRTQYTENPMTPNQSTNPL